MRRKILALDEVTGLAVFFEGSNFKEGLRHFLPPDVHRRDDSPPPKHTGSPRSSAMWRATTSVSMRRRRRRSTSSAAASTRNEPRVMGRRNRDRLDQFDDPENVRRLLAFPEAEAARALRKASASRRARGIERALPSSLLSSPGCASRTYGTSGMRTTSGA